MKHKNIFRNIIGGALIAFISSCSLDFDPISDYSDVTEGIAVTGKEVVFKDKAAVESQLQSIYEALRDQEWYIDKILVAESHSDNAYAGAFNAEVLPWETNSLDATNSLLSRDWNRFLKNVGIANRLIVYADSVGDKSLSDVEIKRYQAQGRIFRAYMFFEMVRLWGEVPVVTKVAPDITAENFDAVYPLYFPYKATETKVYKQIEEDLLFAVQHAPDISSDKRLMTKTVARALLTKVYAEKPIRDYAKVIQYADEVKQDGVELVDDFSLLFGMNDAVTDTKMRNTKESILEAHFVAGAGNWCFMMFGRNLLNWDDSFSWSKWVTPSRDLIKQFETEGDMVRYKESIVYYECGWSLYYPKDNYPFMYKCRSSQSSIIHLRYADILLLKAEAMIQGASPNLSGAAQIIDQVREKRNLKKLPDNVKANQQSMLDALMKERRLELAFEGQRWYDLVRLNKVEEVMNEVFKKDVGRRPQQATFTGQSYRVPVPMSAINMNPKLGEAAVE